METRVHASPTKDFFVTMLTRDISLKDCILDLLDNCIDGARRTAGKGKPGDALTADLSPYHAVISISPKSFEVTDNCGGISLKTAVDYAFHFGRRRNAPAEAFGIGLYGIGLKRALFKLGTRATVTSQHGKESFAVLVDTKKWFAQDEQDWDFDLEEAEPLPENGTVVRVDKLHQPIANELNDEAFIEDLRRTISRDYSFILRRGFTLTLGGAAIAPYPFEVKEGQGFEPVRSTYQIGGVKVELIAGLMADPPDELEPSDGTDRRTPYYGWYVVCNDRIVVAGDKSERTVWGRDEFPSWHFQYNGFLGIVRFTSQDPTKLPWTTTKRDVEDAAPIYRDAVVRMQAITRHFIAYTNSRKANLGAAKKAEQAAVRKAVDKVQMRASPSFPTLPKAATELTTVQYKVSKKRVAAVAQALGDRKMSNRDVGEKTFEYYEQNEVR